MAREPRPQNGSAGEGADDGTGRGAVEAPMALSALMPLLSWLQACLPAPRRQGRGVLRRRRQDLP
jgi:hypothetical protein